MPDLDHPEHPGQVMQPKFFLTSAALAPGRRDGERREQLAEWLTSNEWFAVALVNRLWSELVGEGFYEPVDDLGPDRQASSATAVKLLARKFQDRGYDLKWLLTTICQTEAYQRESRPRRSPTEPAFLANVPQRLRSDQLLNALFTALDVEETEGGKSGYGVARRPRNPRHKFGELFGYDPSESREGIAATIPQSLALMNGNEVNRYVAATKNSFLADLLHEGTENEALIVELYLRCLSREPEEEELARALDYCAETHRRDEVFEDLLWALINSAEFQHRK